MPTGVVTYHELYCLALENTKTLKSLSSFKPHSPVLIHLHDHWDVILWFWSVLMADGLPVLSTPFSNVDEHRQKHVLGLSSLLESPLCITRTEYLPLFDGIGHTFQLQTIESLPTEHDINAGTPIALSTAGCSSETPAMLMLTSGSTGNAKAVVITHRQVLASVAGKSATRALPAGRPFLNWIGLDHVGAFVEIHLHALWANQDQIHLHAADIVSSPTTFLDLLSRHQVSRSFSPNFLLASLVSSAAAMLEQPTWNLSSLTFLVTGGEANDIKTCTAVSELLQKYGARPNVLVSAFGMTETCAASLYNDQCPDYDVSQGYKVSSVGKCIKGMEVRVTVGAPKPMLAQPNEPGDLEVRGDVVFKKYYRNPSATAASFTSEGWFRTGDRGMLDNEGSLLLVGRAKQTVNVQGVQVATADIQASLEQASEGCNLERLVVFPTRAAHTEQVTIACLERSAKPMTAVDMAEIEDRFVQASMMVTASRPVVFAVGPESYRILPITTLGKISGSKMASLFETGAFDRDLSRWRSMVSDSRRSRRATQDEMTSEDEASLIQDFTKIKTVVELGQDEIGPEDSLWDLGYSSMDIVRLKHVVDARLKLSIPLIVFMKNPSARPLAAALSRYQENLLQRKIAALGEAADSRYDPVVPFREDGRKTPLWLVHPGLGEVLVFTGLARELSDDDRPVYALRARGFETGETLFTSIEEIVTTYVKAITRIQPKGPFAISGYSYGVMLAFQVAKRLDALDNGGVKFVGSFNLPPHIKLHMRDLNWNMALLHLTYFLGMITEEDFDRLHEREDCKVLANGQDYRSLGQDVAFDYILSISDERRMAELALGKLELGIWVNVAHGLHSLAVDYEPNGSVDTINVFHAKPLKMVAATREEWMSNHLAKWSAFCRSAPKFIQVGGAHHTMLGPEHVTSFAIILKDALRARGL